MRVRTTMRQMKEAKVAFISLVSRGANRIPFRVIKSEGDNMLDLSQLRHVFKGEAPAQTQTMGFAEILRGGKPAPQTVAKAAPALQSIAKATPVQSIAKPTQPQREQVQEERQQLAPNQAPAPRRAGNNPKVPTSARDTVTLQSLKTEIDNALTEQRKREKAEAWNESRSAFSRVSPTQPHHTAGGGGGSAWDLRNRGGQLAVTILSGEGERLPTNTLFRPFSAAGTKA